MAGPEEAELVKVGNGGICKVELRPLPEPLPVYVFVIWNGPRA